MIEPNNRRCYHCGTRYNHTFQATIWGFRVRLCDPCFDQFLKVLDKFCAKRPDPFAALRSPAGRT